MREGFQREVTPEELFEMLFRRGGGFRTYRPFVPSHNQRHDPNKAYILENWFKFFLFILAFWFVGSFFLQHPPYSLSRTYNYQVRRTVGKAVVLEYWVETSFEKRFPNPGDVRKIEIEVKNEWLRHYETQCVAERRQRDTQLFWASEERKARINATPLRFCDKLEKLYQEVEVY